MKNSLAVMAVSAVALMSGINHAKAEMPVNADMQKQHEQMMNDISTIKQEHAKILEDHKMMGEKDQKIMDEHKQIMADHKRLMEDHRKIMDEHREMKKDISDLESRQ